MAALGPRELDVGWMIFLHCFFDELARSMGMPGLPDFMRPADVAATYRDLTGHEVRDLEFYQVYAALRHGIVMTRVHARLAERDPEIAGRIHPNDPQRIQRALEVIELTGRKMSELQQEQDDDDDD